MRVLVTGGAGYIGSHTVIELIAAGHEVVIYDNLANSSMAGVDALRTLANRSIAFLRGDVLDPAALDQAFTENDFDAVIHFAAFKAVKESVENPLKYYQNNVQGTVNLLDRMAAHGVRTIVFSSSATVYGDPDTVPITEDAPTRPANPYGRSKLAVEEILRDLHAADDQWAISILRYFNPVGAHLSGEIGEDPHGIPDNLMPLVARVAVGRHPEVHVFGNDYDTPDGTGVRDYIHVVDLAKGHVKALDYLAQGPGLGIHNLGTGNGYSVLETIRAFEEASGVAIPHRIVGRRPGDVAASYSDPSKAERDLGWTAELGLDRMCKDLWRWQSSHPNGYADTVDAQD